MTDAAARLRDVLSRIQALTTNPHWTVSRRWRIEELAREGLAILDEGAPPSTRASEADRAQVEDPDRWERCPQVECADARACAGYQSPPFGCLVPPRPTPPK